MEQFKKWLEMQIKIASRYNQDASLSIIEKEVTKIRLKAMQEILEMFNRFKLDPFFNYKLLVDENELVDYEWQNEDLIKKEKKS